MIVVRCAFVLCVLTACTLEAAVEPIGPPTIVIHSDPIVAFAPPQLTLSIVHVDPLAPAPLSLWADPRARASRDYVATQLSLLLRGGIAPQADLSGGFQWLALEVQAPSATDPDRTRARFGLLVDHALARDLARAVAATMPATMAEGLQGFTGAGNALLFAGAAPPLLCIGDPQLLNHRLPQTPRLIPSSERPLSALSLHCDFAPTMSMIKKLEAAGIYYNLDTLLPRWRQEAPVLDARIEPASGGWQGSLHLIAKNLPLHAVDPAFARLLTPGKHIEALLGISPIAVLQLIANLMTSEDITVLEGRLGMPLNAVADCFTGDALLEVQADSVIPLGALALNLRPNGRNKLLISHLAAIWNGVSTPAPESSITMWVITTVVGPVVLAYNKDRLVVGDDAALMLQLLSGQPGAGAAAPAPAPAPICASLRVDLPALSAQWLPLLWPLLADQHLDIGPAPMLPISFQLPVLATALLQRDPATAKLSTLLAVPPPTLHIQQGATQTQVAISPQLPAVVRGVLSSTSASGIPLDGAALAQALDDSFAVYADSHQVPLQVTAMVVRLPDGFHILEEDRSVRHPGLSAPQLATHLGDYQRVMGPEPAALRPLGPSTPARLDLHWLPGPAALSAFLQPYSAAVTVTPAGASLTEQGEPLATLACSAACLYLLLVEQPHMLLYQERFAAPGTGAAPVGVPAAGTPGVNKTVQF